MAVISIMVLILMVLRVLSYAPFFDETMHVRFLWLLSTGLKPEADYFCQYPVLAYIVALPLVKLLPESVYLVLVLRGTSVVVCCLIGLVFYRHGRNSVGSGIAGLLPFLVIAAAPDIGAFLAEYSIDHLAALAAIGAMTLFFRRCGAVGLGTACGLSLFSVVVTPKYVLPLFFGLLGLFAAGLLRPGWRQRGRMVAAVVAGGLAASLLVVVLYWLANVSLADNFHYAHLLMAKFNLDKQNQDTSLPPAVMAWRFVSRHWLLTMVLTMGPACWVTRVRRAGLLASLPGAGVILGMAVFAFAAWRNLRLEQYMTPMLFSTALFAPYAFPNRDGTRLLNWLRWSLLAAAALVISFQFFSVAGEFRQSPLGVRSAASTRCASGRVSLQPPLLKVLTFYDSILYFVPHDERVVAAWPYHPLFRKDLTWVTNDDRPSFSRYLPPDDPALRFFAADTFREALEKNPPALIVTAALETNYPPGWEAECRDFLIRHYSWYVLLVVDSSGFRIAVRRDLVPNQDAAADRFRKSMEIEINDPMLLIDLGNKLANLGQWDKAIAKYQKALKIDPDNALAHNNLGASLVRRQRVEEAIAHFQKALENCSDKLRMNVHTNFGDVLAGQGKVTEAMEHYDKALALASAQSDRQRVEEIGDKIRRCKSDALRLGKRDLP